MKRIIFLIAVTIASYTALAQNRDFEITAGPELLRSFNHTATFWGIGGSVQAEAWVLPALGVGINTGYYHFSSANSITTPTYSAIPILALVRYPIPIVDGLYGQDAFGYTFVDNVSYLKTGVKVPGAGTYYFALGYVINNHLDISLKIGRPFLGKKDNAVNVNEHNLGLKIAYRL